MRGKRGLTGNHADQEGKALLVSKVEMMMRKMPVQEFRKERPAQQEIEGRSSTYEVI